MNLVKDKWTSEDRQSFLNYLKNFSRPEKVEWTQNILQTNLPTLALLTKDVRKIIKEILKGNYIYFLEQNWNDTYENIAINGVILCHIKDFDKFVKYLYPYMENIDCWAHCDILSVKFKNKEKETISLTKKLIKSQKPFERRVGIVFLFKLLDTDEYLNEIFEILNSFENETHYYVNMVNAWLICDLFIKHRERTLQFLQNHKLNKFTINKAISKCRDSFRVSKDDKEMLLSFKKQ